MQEHPQNLQKSVSLLVDMDDRTHFENNAFCLKNPQYLKDMNDTVVFNPI